jgi:subfamily B ATP-binding cassette protein MsbA
MNEYKKILKFARPHQKYIYGSLFFNLLYSVFQIASLGTILPVLGMLFGTIKREKFTSAPVYSGDLVDLFSYLKTYSNYYIQTLVDSYGTLNVLAWLCIITAFMFLLRNIFRYLGSFLLINYRVGVTKDLRGEMYRKVLSLPVSFFTESRKGDMMSRMSNDVGEVEGNILGSLVDLINAPFMLISTLISLFWLSSELTLFSLLVLPVMGTMIALIGKSLKRSAERNGNDLLNR